MKNINDLLQETKKAVIEAKRINEASDALLKKIQSDCEKYVQENEKKQIRLDKITLKTVQQLDRSVLNLIKETE